MTATNNRADRLDALLHRREEDAERQRHRAAQLRTQRDELKRAPKEVSAELHTGVTFRTQAEMRLAGVS